MHDLTPGLLVVDAAALLSRRVRAEDEGRPGATGSGINGVVVHGPGGAIGLSLEDADPSAFASGTARISYVSGVGIPEYPPTNAETGC